VVTCAREVRHLSVVTAAYPPDVGGIADHSYLLARALARRGVTVEVVTTAQADASPDDVQVRRVKADWTSDGARQVAAALAERPACAVLFQYVPHLYGPRGLSSGAVLLPRECRRLGMPVLVHFHEVALDWSLSPSRFLLAALHRVQALRMIAHADGVIFSNQRDRRMCRWMLSLYNPPCCILASGATAPALQELSCDMTAIRSRYSGGCRHLVVIYGLASRGKRYDLAVRALRLLREQGLDVRLIFAGDQEAGDAAYCQETRKLVKSIGLESYVLWTGRISAPEVSSLLASADCMWHLERGGITTRNGTVACALSAGLPIVTLGHHGLDSCFSDGENVLLTGGSTDAGLAERTNELFTSEDLATRISRGAGELHDRVFSWSVIASRYIELMSKAGVAIA
jgi:glycosyltransferase involved in cell wall biosynthesis